jgi:hypothetical protein
MADTIEAYLFILKQLCSLLEHNIQTTEFSMVSMPYSPNNKGYANGIFEYRIISK